MRRWLKNGVVVGMVLSMSLTIMGEQRIKIEPIKVNLNERVKEVPGGMIRIGQEILLPVRWLADEMGAKEVAWDSKERTVNVEIPIYSEEHRYLSYLNGLYTHDKEGINPLPERAVQIKWPDYPLKGNSTQMIQERPIGVTISDDGFQIPFVAYDYEIVDNKVYLGSDWFNAMFLAEIKQDGNTIDLSYMTEEELMQKIAEIEKLLKPRTPEEALNLWIRGQQVRSGALQYVALSPELQQEVLEKKRGWVTGGSSPSAGEAVITEVKDLGERGKLYKVSLKEMLQGKVSGEVVEEIQVKKYEEQGETYWLITQASGDLGYFSILTD